MTEKNQTPKAPTVELDTGAPLFDAKQGYTASWFRTFELIGQAILSYASEPSNPTIRLMVRYGISLIPNKAEREKILDVINKELDKEIGDEKDVSVITRIANEVYITIGCGMVHDWFDNFTGYYKKNVWGVTSVSNYGYDDKVPSRSDPEWAKEIESFNEQTS
jgi:hypothetical protein